MLYKVNFWCVKLLKYAFNRKNGDSRKKWTTND